jgi:Phosphodiester glycosidase
MNVSIPRLMLLAASVLAAACALAGCGSRAAAAAHPAYAAPSTAQASPAAVPPSPVPPSPSPVPPSPSQLPPSQSPVPPPQPRVSITRVRVGDGALVTVATFLGPVRYVLHNGSADPGAAAAGAVRAGPFVTGAERRQLIAAFNGGFRLSAGVGGYMQEGHVISPLRPGFASLVIDRSGQGRIGVWGSRLPTPHEAVYSVRQNLQPLVLNGRPTAAAADWTLWGATLGGGAFVARSAVGQDAADDLIYAASMSAVPADLASVLASHGARTAMELDINPEWVELDVAGKPGGGLTAALAGQYRPADQYLVGWTRDFVTVLAAPASPPAAAPNLSRFRP